jgi:hypothetical protein
LRDQLHAQSIVPLTVDEFDRVLAERSGEYRSTASRDSFATMTRKERLVGRILSGSADQNIRFDDLCNVLRDLGFNERTRGSHHIFARTGIE